MQRRDVVIYSLAFLLSGAVHVAVMQGAGNAKQWNERARREAAEMALVVVEIQQPEPPAVDLSDLPPPPRKKKVVPPPSHIEEAPPPDPKLPPPPPVFGISMSSMAEPGQGTGFTVRSGNTIMKEREEEFTEPEAVRPYIKPVSVAAVTVRPKLLRDYRPPYPKKAEALEIEGEVKLRLHIDAQGKVGRVELLEGLGYGLDEAALSAAKRFLFSPAMLGDQAVATVIVYRMRFELEY